jgi:hypothetical protein
MKEALYGMVGVVLGALSICYSIAFLATPAVVFLAAIKYLNS